MKCIICSKELNEDGLRRYQLVCEDCTKAQPIDTLTKAIYKHLFEQWEIEGSGKFVIRSGKGILSYVAQLSDNTSHNIERVFCTKEDAEEFMETLKGDWDYQIVEIMQDCARRITEVRS